MEVKVHPAHSSLGEWQYRLYLESEAPAEPKPSSAGASLSQWDPWQVDFILPLALLVNIG